MEAIKLTSNIVLIMMAILMVLDGTNLIVRTLGLVCFTVGTLSLVANLGFLL